MPTMDMIQTINREELIARCPELELTSLELKHERWVKKTLRQVYTDKKEIVIKCFFHFPGRRDYRRPWVQEDRALRKLSGLNVPSSFGYFKTKAKNGIRTVIYIKQYIKGAPITRIDAETASAMGTLFSQFHQRGVVTMDPSLSNFIRLTDGSCSFIDFGRARIYSKKRILLPVMIGKEFYRIFRRVFNEQGLLMKNFRKSYFASFNNCPQKNITIIDKSFKFWQKRYAKKYG
jgi:tRNA A-37 threonylcarbamoyl transferase component Bud32